MVMQTLVVAIIALIVLVILIFIFRTQIGDLSSRYTDIAEKSEKAASEESCGGFFTNTRCTSGTCAELGEGWTTSSVKGCPTSKSTCCEKT